MSKRLVAGTILGLGVAVAVLLPNGYACTGDEQLGRQWSYFQERWFYGCRPSAEDIDRGIPYHPMGALTDWRIPLRILAILAGLAIAWRLLAAEQPDSWSPQRWSWILVGLFTVFGGTVALLLALHPDSYCVFEGRGPGSLTCSFKSILGFQSAPGVIEALWALIGAAVGALVGFVAGFGFLRRESAVQAGVDAARRG